MSRVRMRDPKAFEQLWDTYWRFVYGNALRILGQAPVAEDVTQMVFLKIWANPAAFSGGSFGAWVSRVTRNLAIDQLRRGSGIVFVELDNDMESDVTLHELVFARFDAHRLYEYLRTISDRNRRLLELSFFEGRTHVEIAALLRMPLGTVKTRIRAGIRDLRTRFEGDAKTISSS